MKVTDGQNATGSARCAVGNSFLDHEIAVILRGIGLGIGDALGRNTDQRTN
jgi:hypothetical protein